MAGGGEDDCVHVCAELARVTWHLLLGVSSQCVGMQVPYGLYLNGNNSALHGVPESVCGRLAESGSNCVAFFLVLSACAHAECCHPDLLVQDAGWHTGRGAIAAASLGHQRYLTSGTGSGTAVTTGA